MNARPLLPSATATLDDGDDLLGDTSGKHVAARGTRTAFGGGVEDPTESCAAALAETEGYGDLEGDATACCTALGADAEEGGYAVDGEGEVEDWD